jgi:Rod binding domain-containing protein
VTPGIVTSLTGAADAAIPAGKEFAPALRPANSGNSNSAAVSKLTKAAGEFESILLESLWKSMKETFSDPDEDADPTLKSFDDWGIHAMASAVGASGGLGIKNMILKYLEPTLPGGSSGAPAAQ